MQNYKIYIIIGGIILVVFVIFAIAGVVNSKDKSSNSLTLSDLQRNISVSDKMKELKIMLDNGLISQEEFDTKKKEMIDKM